MGEDLKLIEEERFSIENGHTKIYKIFGLNVLQKTRYNFNKNKIQYKFLFQNQIDKNRQMFYLKFNSNNFGYSIFCLQHWINVINEIDADFIIICDKQELIKEIKKHIIFKNDNIKIIKSDKKIPQKIVKSIASDFWLKAGIAHLTTFFHAKKNGINEFWNIDADDTAFMSEPKVIASALTKIKHYADKNKIEAFSLDMHRSHFYGKHWSFGVTYINNGNYLMQLIKNVKNKEWHNDKKLYDKQCNLDWYFTYLLDTNQANIGTFNIDNIYFVHFGLFTSLLFFSTSIQITYDNKLEYIIANRLFNMKNSVLPIYNDCINFNFGFNPDDSFDFCKSFIKMDPTLDNVFSK
ncbi:MAG: hypothetical protein ACI4SM_02055 [Candidatus Gastranaerophilaceae bacterium]